MRIILSCVLSGLVLIGLSGCGKSASEIREDLAPAVCDYLEANFDKLDSDKNGKIDSAELRSRKTIAEAARKSGTPGAEFEVELLGHIIDNLERIGHVISSHTEEYTDVTYVPIGDGLFPIYSTGTRTVYDYGISLQDVKSYRLKTKK